jgi:hypothetical protein
MTGHLLIIGLEVTSMKMWQNLVNRLFPSASTGSGDQLYFNIDEVRKFKGQRELNSAEANETLQRDAFFRL